MPHPALYGPDDSLEHSIINTMMDSFHRFRPDLLYPQSTSDMQAAVRGLLQMFKVEYRTLPRPLRLKCNCCEGLGSFIQIKDNVRHIDTCTLCEGRGWISG